MMTGVREQMRESIFEEMTVGCKQMYESIFKASRGFKDLKEVQFIERSLSR
jgi:hypothetical protein